MDQKKPIITVTKISKTYRLGDVQVPALQDVSLKISEGEFLIITGRNGSGKSTLLRQLGLLDFPNSGEIFLRDRKVTAMKESQRVMIRLKHLGYIFQEYALIAELTALENVMLPSMMLGARKQHQTYALELLKKVGLSSKEKNLPRQLSGGEQQKVAIARALVNKPDVIFADEPTANLDTVAAHEVLEIFKRLNEERHCTIVMITHEEDETKYATRQIQLADGKII